MILGLFNVTFGLLPEAYGVSSPAFSLVPARGGYRTWNGQKALGATVQPGDLVIALGHVHSAAYEFLGISVPVDELVIETLAKRYWDNIPAFQAQIRQQVDARLARGQRVLVYAFYGEDNVKMSWPWSTLPGFTIGPETVQSVLDEYRAMTLSLRTPYAVGITRLDRPAIHSAAGQGK